MVRWGWLLVEYICSISAEFAVFERDCDVGGMGEFTTATVNQHGTIFHILDAGGANHVACLFGEIRMQRDDVAFA